MGLFGIGSLPQRHSGSTVGCLEGTRRPPVTWRAKATPPSHLEAHAPAASGNPCGAQERPLRASSRPPCENDAPVAFTRRPSGTSASSVYHGSPGNACIGPLKSCPGSHRGRRRRSVQKRRRRRFYTSCPLGVQGTPAPSQRAGPCPPQGLLGPRIVSLAATKGLSEPSVVGKRHPRLHMYTPRPRGQQIHTNLTSSHYTARCAKIACVCRPCCLRPRTRTRGPICPARTQ